jgi:hypothetical protein
MVIAVGVISCVSSAALVLSLVALTKHTVSDNASPAGPQARTGQPGSTDDADKALCTAIAPLIKEDAERGKAFVGLGDSGTPARDGAIPDFLHYTQDWTKQIQPVLDQHPDASPYLTRTLQRYIDDRRIYAGNIRPGPEQDADAAAWNDATVAIGGPLEVCGNLGIKIY